MAWIAVELWWILTEFISIFTIIAKIHPIVLEKSCLQQNRQKDKRILF